MSDRYAFLSSSTLRRHDIPVRREGCKRKMSHVVEAHGLILIPFGPPIWRFPNLKYCRGLSPCDSARAGRVGGHGSTQRSFDHLECRDGVGRLPRHGVPHTAVARLLAHSSITACTACTAGANGAQQLRGTPPAVELRSGTEQMEALCCLWDWRSQ
jgi:hypothetical protein